MLDILYYIEVGNVEYLFTDSLWQEQWSTISSGTDGKPQCNDHQNVSLKTFQRTHELTMNSWGVQISDEGQ